MELVTRKFLKIGSTYGTNYVKEAGEDSREDPESSMYDYNNRPISRREYLKCLSCRFRLKPKICEKFACMRNERKDNQSVYFQKI